MPVSAAFGTQRLIVHSGSDMQECLQSTNQTIVEVLTTRLLATAESAVPLPAQFVVLAG